MPSRSPAAPPLRTDPASAPATEATIPPPRFWPKILLVDDDAAVRDALGRVLAAESLNVTKADCVKGALDHLLTTTPDLVLTDLCMSPLTGWDLIAHLENHFPALPVIAMSALPQKFTAGIERRVQAYFSKPLDFDALLAGIRHELSLNRPRPGAAPLAS